MVKTKHSIFLISSPSKHGTKSICILHKSEAYHKKKMQSRNILAVPVWKYQVFEALFSSIFSSVSAIDPTVRIFILSEFV